MNMKYIIAVDLEEPLQKSVSYAMETGRLCKNAFSSRFGYDSKFAGD